MPKDPKFNFEQIEIILDFLGPRTNLTHQPRAGMQQHAPRARVSVTHQFFSFFFIFFFSYKIHGMMSSADHPIDITTWVESTNYLVGSKPGQSRAGLTRVIVVGLTRSVWSFWAFIVQVRSSGLTDLENRFRVGRFSRTSSFRSDLPSLIRFIGWFQFYSQAGSVPV